MKNIYDVGKIVGLSRRMIQEYQAAGLVSIPEKHKDNGCKIYTQKEINELWQMKFYKEMDYKIPDITKHREAGGRFTEEELITIISDLKKKRKILDNVIKIAEAMKATGLGFEGISSMISVSEDLPADDAFDIMGTSLDVFKYYDSDNDNNEGLFNDEELDSLFDCGLNVINCFEKGLSVEDEETQRFIKGWHVSMDYKMADSVLPFGSITAVLSQGSEIRDIFTDKIEPKKIDYLLNAIQYYCSQNSQNSHAKQFDTLLNNIAILGSNNYLETSKEVQETVEKLYNHMLRLRIYSRGMVEAILRSICNVYRSDAITKMLDEGSAFNEADFVANAIEIYLNKKGDTKQ